MYIRYTSSFTTHCGENLDGDSDAAFESEANTSWDLFAMLVVDVSNISN